MKSASPLVTAGHAAALDLLHASAHPEGFVASASFRHYNAIWARDASITMLGANASGDPALLACSRATIETLARVQSHLGQIVNAYWPDRSYWDWGETGATDATAWFVIAAIDYWKVTGDDRFLQRVRPHIERALEWLSFQDANNVGLITSPEAGEWMDSSLNRSGKVLYVNVLYEWALRGAGDIAGDGLGYLEAADALRDRIRLFFWPRRESDYSRLLDHVPYPSGARRDFPHPASLRAYAVAIDPNRRFFLSHGTFGRFFDRCDVLANVLAVLTGVADADQAGKILDYLRHAGAGNPYPARSWVVAENGLDQPYELLKPAADANQDERWRNAPNRYHNGAVWPFIGGFYAAALARSGRQAAHEDIMTRLAAANRLAVDGEWGFHEWIDAGTGAPGGTGAQAWNAGAYVFAFMSGPAA